VFWAARNFVQMLCNNNQLQPVKTGSRESNEDKTGFNNMLMELVLSPKLSSIESVVPKK
jgi:hypothetical protein